MTAGSGNATLGVAAWRLVRRPSGKTAPIRKGERVATRLRRLNETTKGYSAQELQALRRVPERFRSSPVNDDWKAPGEERGDVRLRMNAREGGVCAYRWTGAGWYRVCRHGVPLTTCPSPFCGGGGGLCVHGIAKPRCKCGTPFSARLGCI